MDSLPSFSYDEIKLKLPCSLICSGPSSAGKSTFLIKLLSEAADLMEPVPKSFLYCYGQFSSHVPLLKSSGVNVHAGVPSDELLEKLEKPAVVVLDDLMTEISERQITDFFTKKWHHMNLCLIFVTQDPFYHRKIKIARQNTTYFVLLNSPNAMLSIRNLGMQLFPRQLDFFLTAYKDATSRPWGYLFIDLSPKSNPYLRLRTCIFKEDPEKIFYVPKNSLNGI